MMSHPGASGAGAYRHEALFYAGEGEFLGAMVPFLQDAIGAKEPTLVVVSAQRIAALRDALGPDAHVIIYADMAEVGRNPARIIPVWDAFIRERGAPGTRLRGIGEPIWSTRSAVEISECQRHEALLNMAFADPALWLMCPYDVDTLSAKVLSIARRTHPYVSQGGHSCPSASFPGTEDLLRGFSDPLPDAPRGAYTLVFDARALLEVRSAVARCARMAGLGDELTTDLVLAINEVTTNSITHGGGHGKVRVWSADDTVICEVRDRGTIEDPMVDRLRPDLHSGRGRGLWLANQLCDLVQIRSGRAGTSVRLHMRVAGHSHHR